MIMTEVQYSCSVYEGLGVSAFASLQRPCLLNNKHPEWRKGPLLSASTGQSANSESLNVNTDDNKGLD